MDWKHITEEANNLLTLDYEDAQTYLKTLNLPDAQRQLLSGHFEKTSATRAFMGTYSPDSPDMDFSLKAGDLLSHWRIVRPIALGGMGEVYEAKRADGTYEQVAALKLMQGINAKRLEQFDRERQQLAQLEHANISRIIDGGTHTDGRPFVVMEYVDGQPILSYSEVKNLSLSGKLNLFLSLCDAVAYAHSKLVLHRDIKSENVLVNGLGRVRLIDFGISSDLSDHAHAGSAFSLFTAAPEQLKGESLGVETDIFSLGVVLHQMLCGTLPARQSDGSMTVDGLSHTELAAIISQCLCLNPKDRYGAVQMLERDIKAYLEKQPVSAVNGGPFYKFGKRLRRHPFASLAVSAFAVSLVGGLSVSTFFARQATEEAQAARAELERSEYFREVSDIQIGIDNAQLDAMQRVVGATGNNEQVTKALMDRWEEAWQNREADPIGAAQISFAVGRYFLFRNDYVTADEILSAWISEDFGTEHVRYMGRSLLGSVKLNLGQSDEALKAYREARDYFATTHLKQSPDHISMATNAALISENPEELAEAEKLVLIGLEVKEYGPSINMFYWFQIAKMRKLNEDFEGALSAYETVNQIQEEFPLMEMQGRDTAILTLARTEFYMGRNLEASEDRIDFVLGTFTNTKGESRDLATAHHLKARHHMARGEWDAALTHIEAALPIHARFAGKTSGNYNQMLMTKAEILAKLGETDQARQIMNENVRDGASYALAKARILLDSDGAAAAQAYLNETELNMRKIRQSPQNSYFVEQLVENGLSVPSP